MIKTLTRPKKKSSTREFTVDYPMEGETINYPTYTIRVGAIQEATRVEVSFDYGQWKPCREAMGFWWYDWADYSNGEYDLRARYHKTDGTTIESPVRRFKVRLPR